MELLQIVWRSWSEVVLVIERYWKLLTLESRGYLTESPSPQRVRVSNFPQQHGIRCITGWHHVHERHWKSLLLPPQRTSRPPLDVFLWQTSGYMVGTVLIFGYGQTVMYFTKICLLIHGFLTTSQIKVTNIIDDWGVFEKTEEISNVQHLVTSVLTSFGCYLFHGFLIDIQKYEFRSSIDKIECTRDTIKMIRELSHGDRL